MSCNKEEGELSFEIPEAVSRKSHSLLFIEKKLIPALRDKEKLSEEYLIKLIDEYKDGCKQEHAEADFGLLDLREAADFLYHEKENHVSVNPEEQKLKRQALTFLKKIKSLEKDKRAKNNS